MEEKKEPKTKEEQTTETKPETVAEEKVVAKGKAKKTKRQVSSGRAYIQATYNNTIISLTDSSGNCLTQCSAGQLGFKGPKKSTPYAATMIVAKAAERCRPYGLKEVCAFVTGVGGGREAAIRALNTNGINVISIKDITTIPHNGCRAKKPRRV